MRSDSGFTDNQLAGRLAGRWVWAAAVSLAAHGLLLLPWRPPPMPVQARAPAIKLSLQIQPVAPPPPMPQAPAPAPISAAPARTEPAPAVERPAPSTVALPPAIDWRYLLLQNGRQGQARLTWRPDGAVYALRMEREIDGRQLPGSRSEGRLDPQGLSPLRFTQQRAGRPGQAPRDAAATNFRRSEGPGQGSISFSASAELVPMPDGVQDRISWWLQLAAIVAAAPQRFQPGASLHMPVIGLRGEAMEWVFEVRDEAALDLPVGHIARTVHLRRAAVGPYGGEIELWLDPARHYLPVRLLFSQPDERGWELQLLDEGLPQP